MHEIGGYNKIMIIGSAGSGKTTLSKIISSKIDIPLFHLDKYFWKPGWITPSDDEWGKIHARLIGKESWILDGNYRGTMFDRAIASELIIFLDMNRWSCLYNVIKRWITHIGKTRTDMAYGCMEKIDLEFLIWIYNFPKKNRNAIYELIEDMKDKGTIIIKNRKELKEFINSLKK